MRMGTAMRAMGDVGLVAAVATAVLAGGCASCELSMGGEPWGEMPDLDMLVGDTVEVDEIWRHFLPEECQGPGLDRRFPEGFSTGPHAAESSDSAAVAVSFPDGGELLTIVARDVADSVRVVVWSTMGGTVLGPRRGVKRSGTNDNFHEFRVRVRPRPAGR